MALQRDRTTKKILDLNIDLISYEDTLLQIVEWGKSKQSGYVCFANVHMTIEAHDSRNFAQQVNGAMLVLPDGMPIVKSLKYIHGKSQDRVAGMDILPDLLKLAESNSLKIFFFGSSDEILEKIKIRARVQFPKLEIVGLFSPPFDKTLDDETYIETIKMSAADLVFIALGCPKQEKWMANHAHKISAPLLGVGGAFSVYAGAVRRAPVFIQNAGLEWAFRLLQEPGRLFKRYLRTNTLFVYLILRAKIKKILRSPVDPKR